MKRGFVAGVAEWNLLFGLMADGDGKVILRLVDAVEVEDALPKGPSGAERERGVGFGPTMDCAAASASLNVCEDDVGMGDWVVWLR